MFLHLHLKKLFRWASHNQSIGSISFVQVPKWLASQECWVGNLTPVHEKADCWSSKFRPIQSNGSESPDLNCIVWFIMICPATHSRCTPSILTLKSLFLICAFRFCCHCHFDLTILVPKIKTWGRLSSILRLWWEFSRCFDVSGKSCADKRSFTVLPPGCAAINSKKNNAKKIALHCKTHL